MESLKKMILSVAVHYSFCLGARNFSGLPPCSDLRVGLKEANEVLEFETGSATYKVNTLPTILSLQPYVLTDK